MSRDINAKNIERIRKTVAVLLESDGADYNQKHLDMAALLHEIDRLQAAADKATSLPPDSLPMV